MYVRQVKQFLRGVDPTFDERRYGFASLNDLLRASQREGLFRMERDRQGVMRFFQGNVMKPVASDTMTDVAETVEVTSEAMAQAPQSAGQDLAEGEVVDGDVVQELETPLVVDAEEASASDAQPQEEPRPARRRRAPKAASGAARAPREKKPARPRAPRKKSTPQVEA
jgi:hypothetical protein